METNKIILALSLIIGLQAEAQTDSTKNKVKNPAPPKQVAAVKKPLEKKPVVKTCHPDNLLVTPKAPPKTRVRSSCPGCGRG